MISNRNKTNGSFQTHHGSLRTELSAWWVRLEAENQESCGLGAGVSSVTTHPGYPHGMVGSWVKTSKCAPPLLGVKAVLGGGGASEQGSDPQTEALFPRKLAKHIQWPRPSISHPCSQEKLGSPISAHVLLRMK